MTQWNGRRDGKEDGGDRRGRGRSRSYVHDDPPPQEPAQRTGSRHWMHDPEPPRVDFGADRNRDERGTGGARSHAGYGDYGLRDYDPLPERGEASRPDPRWGGGSATRPRDFRDYGRGDYRGNVGPGGFGYAESNYGPTRYREAHGRTGHEPGDAAQEMERERRSHAGRGPRDYRRSDERVRELICERLTDDPHVDASEVTVEVRGGVITLSGSVPDRRMKHRIEDIAADLAREDDDVRNEVRVAASS